MRQHLVFGLFVFFISGHSAFAKTKVDVSPVRNQAAGGSCNVVEAWKKDIETAFQFQLINALNETGNFEVVESERFRGEKREALFESGVSTVHKRTTYKSGQYSVSAVLKAFDLCDREASVILEVSVTENSSGNVVNSFQAKGSASRKDKDTSFLGAMFNTGVFKDSPLGVATMEVIKDVSQRLKKAFPNREIASDMEVQTVRKGRSR